MLYTFLAFFVLAALFLIFRDDHDPSYNKDEKSPRKDPPRISSQYRQPESAAPKAEKAPASPSLKEQILGEIAQSLQEARDGLKESAQVAREALDEAREAISTTVKEAQEGWTAEASAKTETAVTNEEAEEPSPEDWEDEDEPDLSFLDNITYFSDLEETTDMFDIAGLRYHCTVHDCGHIVGIVRPEPENVHDSRAQAVIRSDEKLLGYIPRTQLDWYEDFNRTNEECPFVGTIELDHSSARLIGEIKVILPSNEEFVREEIEYELDL